MVQRKKQGKWRLREEKKTGKIVDKENAAAVSWGRLVMSRQLFCCWGDLH